MGPTLGGVVVVVVVLVESIKSKSMAVKSYNDDLVGGQGFIKNTHKNRGQKKNLSWLCFFIEDKEKKRGTGS